MINKDGGGHSCYEGGLEVMGGPPPIRENPDYDNRERGRNVKSFLNENGTLISKR